MGLVFEDNWSELISIVVVLIVVTISYFRYSYQFWEKQGVPTIPPKLPLGNANIFLPRGQTISSTLAKTFYDEFKRRGCSFGGVYLFTEPNLIIVDPEYIKDVLTKDFSSFVNRGVYYNERDDPLSAHLFAVDGGKWKFLRTKLTPTFTSGKMKMMFHTIVECSQYMSEALQPLKKGDDVDVKEIMGRFTTDVIGLCAFGINCNSFKDPDAEFRTIGRGIFRKSFWKGLRTFFILYLPQLARSLHLVALSPEVSKFFLKVIKETVRTRVESNIHRNDFMQLIIELQQKGEFTIEEMAAEVVVFFIAGFDTSSTAMTFGLYEIAKDEEIQSRLREEILEVLEKHDNQVTYESINEMKYLSQVFEETLRKYPSVPNLTRRCTQDYTLRDTKVVLRKGQPIIIPLMGLHMDPEYYPDPEKFDPERFNEENKKNRKSFTYLPFGDGPRNCIGLRFGTMQSKIGIITVLRDFKVTVSPNCEKVEFDPYGFLLGTTNKILLRLEKL